MIPIMLSSSFEKFPIPATIPCEFRREFAAIFDKVASSPPSIAEPVNPRRSGPFMLLNLVMPIGTSPSSAPAKIVSTPRLLAAVSDNSTMIASTRT